MRFPKSAGVGCAILLFCVAAIAQPAKDESDIKQVFNDQVAAWNRGDIDTFMHGYKDSPDTTFIGKTVNYGYRPIFERYKTAYSTPAAMGKLDFSEFAVRFLGSNYAVATGKYHLARTATGGGDASGIFSTILEREPEGWRIILDHTSSN